jgi:hypothetical protein
VLTKISARKILFLGLLNIMSLVAIACITYLNSISS